MIELGQITTVHQLGNIPVDTSFITYPSGRVEYSGISYPKSASGWWAIVERFTDKGIVLRRIHTSTKVIVTSIRLPDGKKIQKFESDTMKKYRNGEYIP